MKSAKEVLKPKAQRGRNRLRQRCIGCGSNFPAVNAMSSTVGLCPTCSFKSPYSWRTVYDREQHIGSIPTNLAPAR